MSFRMTEPHIDTREAQPYVGVRAPVTMADLGSGKIPEMIDEAGGWLSQQGLAPAGPPFILYHVIDMARILDVTVGWPVASPVEGSGRISSGVIPAGRYMFLVYTGVQNGIEGNRALLDWGKEQGLTLDVHETPEGDAFGGRVEWFLMGPADDPDPANWDTEVAIRLADELQA